jgi:hypothetical protein
MISPFWFTTPWGAASRSPRHFPQLPESFGEISWPQKGHRLHPPHATCNSDGPVGSAERFLRQPNITRAVLDQQNLLGHVGSFTVRH